MSSLTPKQVEKEIHKLGQRGELHHLEETLELNRISKRLIDEVEPAALQKRLNYFGVLPRLFQLEILEKKIANRTLSQAEEKKLVQLEKAYVTLNRSKQFKPIMGVDFENDRLHCRRFNPANHSEERLRYLLVQNGKCFYDKQDFDSVVRNFYMDTLFGPTQIISIEKGKLRKEFSNKPERKNPQDKSIKAVGKFFATKDLDGTVALAADQFAYGSYHAKSLADWQNEGNAQVFAYGPAVMLYLAEKMGITRLVFCDKEMEEFAKQCGVTKQQVYGRVGGKTSPWQDKRKIGIETVGDNSRGVWNHVHGIYNYEHGRYTVLDYQVPTAQRLAADFNQCAIALNENIKPIRPGQMNPAIASRMQVSDRMNVMYKILQIMEDIHYGDRRFQLAKREYNKTVDEVKSRNPNSDRDYVR